MTTGESYDPAHSHSAKWGFKNKPGQPGAMCTKAVLVRFPKNELEWFQLEVSAAKMPLQC